MKLLVPYNSKPQALGKYSILKALSVMLSLWASYLFLSYWDNFGGDPEIHLIFAKNLLNGHVLEFNPGFKSGGETSFLYMLITALLFKVFGIYTQLAMKAIGFISLYFICVAIYRSSIKNSVSSIHQSNRRFTAFYVVLLFLSMAFVPFQAGLGMENILLAAALAWFVYQQSNSFNPDWKYFLFALCLFLLRPEAIIISIFYFTNYIYTKNKSSLHLSILLVIADFFIYKILGLVSGVDSQSAGLMRSYLAKISAYEINPLGIFSIFVSAKTLIASLYMVPFLILLFAKRKLLSISSKCALIAFIIFPFLLHLLTIFPDNHISRYLIYTYAILFVVFAKDILASISSRSIILVTLFVLLISSQEFAARQNLSKFSVFESINSMTPGYIQDYSDYLFKNLSNNPDQKVVIAATEVQIRGRLDNRFVVWSLDGITDSKLYEFANESFIDHESYLKYRKVNYIQDRPNYNRDPYAPSLESLPVYTQHELNQTNFKNLSVSEVPMLSGHKFYRLNFPH